MYCAKTLAVMKKVVILQNKQGEYFPPQTKTKNMKKVKTLEQLKKLAGEHQITAQTVLNGRVFTAAGGWERIELTPELRKMIATDISAILGGYTRTKESITYNLRTQHPQHWGLSRIILEKHGNSAEQWEYITGQEANCELRIIRNFLK